MTAFIQAAHTSSGSNLPITRIVIHGTVSPCQPGNARAVAGYFSGSGSGGSAHYVVDPTEIVQCVQENVIAWHAPPNAHSLGVELSDPQTGDGARWADANHDAMLKLAAGLVRDLAAKYGIPVVKLSPADLLAGKQGICGHVDVSAAWHQTDHVDPGPDFPWDRFLSYVNNSGAASGIPSTFTNQPTAPPVDTREHDMRLIRVKEDGRIFEVGPNLFQHVTDLDHANALATVWGPWQDIDIVTAQRLQDQTNADIVATKSNLGIK